MQEGFLPTGHTITSFTSFNTLSRKSNLIAV